MMAVYDSLRLHLTSEKFIIEPQDSGINELLLIDRVTQEISLQANTGQIHVSAITKPICGILGIIRLVAGPYLVVITKKSKIGEINGHTVWKVVETGIHSYKRTMLHLTEQQIADNKTYLSMVESLLKTDGFYFSMTFDLSHTLQRLQNTSPEFISMSLMERADQRFVWNGHIMREFAQEPELSKYCLPIIHGFISIRSCSINGKTFDYTLISRRSVFRAGTRFFVRGLDSEGQAANFVETEQIVQYDGYRCSLVQTRGSIPLFWSQRPNLKYKPTPVISSTSNHNDGFQRHFDNQIYNYGQQVLVNLIDHKGAEDLLQKAFAQLVINFQNKQIRYESFDFHRECHNKGWDHLSVLLDKLNEERKKYGFLMIARDNTSMFVQDGVFRTNCIDCLDRTNVIQSLIAKVTLQDQLEKLGILQVGQQLVDYSQFDYIFKNVWADNADVLSKQYAGTGALKTDYTRTGKRTKMGLIMDGMNATVRYFKNNFRDGFRQDSIDLFLGNYIVEEQEGITKPSPLRTDRDWKFFALPVIFFIACAMCMISILIPDEHITEQLLYIMFWGVASLVTLLAIYMFGEVFVDSPRLTQAKFKTD